MQTSVERPEEVQHVHTSPLSMNNGQSNSGQSGSVEAVPESKPSSPRTKLEEPALQSNGTDKPVSQQQLINVSAADVAAQCLSPTVPSNLPAEVLSRAREIERHQKQLIADRCGPSPPGSAVSPAITTPFPNTPTAQTSFSTRRNFKPSNLDLGALRRERQLTGPYSANPLLRKRPQEDEEETSRESEQRLPRIDNMTSGPFTPIHRRMTSSSLPAPPPQASAPLPGHAEKKARYMQLCSELFDLLQS